VRRGEEKRGREREEPRLTLTQSVSLRHLTSSMASPLHDFDIFLLARLLGFGLREGKEMRRRRVSPPPGGRRSRSWERRP
jgi:hypothetical protein